MKRYERNDSDMIIEVVPILAKAIRPGMIRKLVPVNRRGNKPYLMRVWTKPDSPAAQGRAATHRGECPYCGNVQMLPGGRLADHGFNLHWGFRNGTCPGSREKPFELSKDFTEETVKKLRNTIKMHQDKIAAGDLNVPQETVNRAGKTIKRDIPRAAIIQNLQGFIAFQENRLKGWKPRPLTPVKREPEVNRDTGLRELNEPEKKVMLEAQQQGDVKAKAELWRGASAMIPVDRIRRLARDGFLEIIEDKTEKEKGYTTSLRVTTIRAKISDRAASAYPALEKPIRGGKLIQAMWEKLKTEGTIKTTPGKSRDYFTALEMAQNNRDRVEVVEDNYKDTYAVIRKR